MQHEEWRPIPTLNGYEASSLGRIRKIQILTPSTLKRPADYPRVHLSKGGTNRKYMVHRLVAAAFLGPIPHGLQVNHKDGNKRNAAPENLEYVTISENHKHAYRVLGKRPNKGSRHGMARIDETKAASIHAMRQSGQPLETIAQRFDVSIATVSMICRGRTWRHMRLPELRDHRLK